MRARLKASLLLPLLLLAGCGSDEPEDVRQWMAESAKNMHGKVPDLPQIQPLPVINYEPGEAAQPFAADKLFAEDAKAAKEGRNGGPKSVNNDAYPLTRVPLESIRLIGTMVIDKVVGKSVVKEKVAIVQADRDASRPVRVGDYIGQNNGRVTAIKLSTTQEDGEILVKETVFEKGVWVERENRIATPGQGDKK